jgi:Holliday junction resolvase-like predicted endonuclease
MAALLLMAGSRAGGVRVAKAYRIVARRCKTPFGQIAIIIHQPPHSGFVGVATALSERSKQAMPRRRVLARSLPKSRAVCDALRPRCRWTGQPAPARHPRL